MLWNQLRFKYFFLTVPLSCSAILPTFGTGQAILGWFSGHTRSLSDYPMHVYLSLPAGVPWQEALTGRTTLRRLLDAQGWIAENEVFLMRL